MSEFSESYHIRTDNIADGIALLQQMKLDGIVFPPTHGWVSFIVRGELNQHIETVAAAWKKRVLHYLYAEDHAFMVNYFDRGDRVTGFLAQWEDELHTDREDLKLEIFRLFLLDKESGMELEKLFEVSEIAQVFEDRLAYKFCDLLGITHYKWLGGSIMERPELVEEILKRSPGAELVRLAT